MDIFNLHSLLLPYLYNRRVHPLIECKMVVGGMRSVVQLNMRRDNKIVREQIDCVPLQMQRKSLSMRSSLSSSRPSIFIYEPVFIFIFRSRSPRHTKPPANMHYHLIFANYRSQRSCNILPPATQPSMST